LEYLDFFSQVADRHQSRRETWSKSHLDVLHSDQTLIYSFLLLLQSSHKTRQDREKKLQYIGVVKSNRKENEAYSAPFFKELALALARENEGLGFVLKLFS